MFKHFYLKTGQCKYGAPCKFNHPKDIQIPSATQENKSGETETAIKTEGFEVAVKPLVSFSAALLYYSKELPVRPGEADCPFYLKTGRWERALLFVLSALDRLSVKFHHPIDRPAVALSTTKPSQQENVKLTLAGLPRREGAVICVCCPKTGTCKYGATCRFDHPPPGAVVAMAASQAKSDSTGGKA
ncbi:zinc finger CCCH domain-containing protein 37 isoform X1 [Rosa chinensis]|uniref:zinc finger CCCH domain-containing protein 37 isoform X1 n=1 Tax=Rosa chinensis TaxID=74649 RepID=UPI001AD909F6|nr:zinc finger CCCH domain-containing protein 37 isoform X1 [Rosa chinensis]